MSKHDFTRLQARILQENGAFTVRIHLLNHLNTDEFAGGEKTADSIEMASTMIAGIAKEFGIPQPCISINFVMENFKDGTRH